ncbi:MAG: M50 family metallopeptidase [Alphaproteobacteria bacterium]|nr:M50 family metallopeptidase [Alphaproteobacteria bacterium]
MTTPAPTPPSSVRPLWALLGAVVIVVLLPRVPLISVVLRPLAWLGTLAHETGHGLGAVAMGGHLDSVQVFTDGSGVAHASYPSVEPVRRAVVSIAGWWDPRSRAPGCCGRGSGRGWLGWAWWCSGWRC